MNAFTPMVSCLDKLGQIVAILEGMVREGAWLNNGLKDLVLDPEVRAWMARMRELERLPELGGDLQVVDGKFVLLPQPAREVVFNIGAPTPEMIADAGQPSDYVQRQLEKMIEPPKPAGPLVGYTLSAKSPTEGVVCTYAEAPTLSAAFRRCIDEFPWGEKWTEHSVKNTETGEETSVPPWGDAFWDPAIESPGPLLFVSPEQWAEVHKLGDRTGLALDLSEENEDVVDTAPSALSLDDD